MDKKALLRAVYESIDWPALYRAHSDVAREQVDQVFRELQGLLGEEPEAPATSAEFAGKVSGGEARLYVDGASKGNPGPAGFGVVIKAPSGQTALAWGAAIGRATNNVAEYHAVIAALEKARELGAVRVRVFSDSELMVRQLQGTYKVKNDGLRPLHAEALALLKAFQSSAVQYVPREQNAEADALATRAVKAAQK